MKGEMVVYAIGGKVSGTGDYIGKAKTRTGVRRHAKKAFDKGATGVSLHGMGLSGEVAFRDLGIALDMSKLPK